MKKNDNRNIILLFILCFTAFSCDNNDKNIYFRSGIVLTDSLKLPNNTTLIKGNLVQIILEKSTEEGTFIKVKNDSGLVYEQYIGTLCWLNNNLKAKTINSNKNYNLKKDGWLIFDDVQNKNYIVKYDGKKFKIKEENIYFDNKKFYENLLR